MIHTVVSGGKPIVAGTRISVEHILGLLANGVTQKEILKEYPSLTEESIKTALEFAQSAVQKEFPVEEAKQQKSAPKTGKNPIAQKIVEAMKEPPHLTEDDIAALLQAIDEGKQPTRFESPFDGIDELEQQ